MKDLDHLPDDLRAALSGEAFRRRTRLVIPLLTTDRTGFPRASLLTPADVRANSAKDLAVAVRTASRTAANLIRRRVATVLYLHASLVATVQARAGRARVCELDPDRQIFPLRVHRVRIDAASRREGAVALRTGATFTGEDADRLFSPDIFEELGRFPR